MNNTIDPADLIRLSRKRSTKEQRAELLVKAGILDRNGNYDKRYFPKAFIASDKARRKER